MIENSILQETNSWPFVEARGLIQDRRKLIEKKGIINVGGPSQSVYSFAKKNNRNVKKILAKKNNKLPLNQTMNLAKLKKILKT